MKRRRRIANSRPAAGRARRARLPPSRESRVAPCARFSENEKGSGGQVSFRWVAPHLTLTAGAVRSPTVRRLGRILLHALTTFSLLLCLTSAALWVRSYSRSDKLDWTRPFNPAAPADRPFIG